MERLISVVVVAFRRSCRVIARIHRERESRIMISKSGGHHRGIDGSPLYSTAPPVSWLIWGDQPRRHLFNVHSPFAVPLRQRKSSGRLVCMKPAATGHQMAALLHVRCRWGIWDGSIKQIPRSASSSAESRPHGR